MLRKILYFLLLYFLFVLVFTFYEIKAEKQEKELKGLCTKVFDGDTIQVKLDRKDFSLAKHFDTIHIRLIGVDTPELYHPYKPVQYFGQEAKTFTERMVLGKKVRLEFDWQRLDKYDRLLAYVYLPDGRMLNAEIIKQGFGFAYVKYPFKHLDMFRQLESEARKEGRGLWDGEGLKELRWLKEQKREPILLTLTPLCTWEIRYQKYARKVPVAEIPNSLSNLRLWTNEFAPQDLDLRLKQAGWKIIPGSNGEKISVYEMTNMRWGFVSRFGERVNIQQEGIPSFLTETERQVCRK